jgi:biopolymer transport protein ExbD
VLDNVSGTVGPTFVVNDLLLCVAELQAEIISMIDIAFFLLVFFIMITWQMIPGKELNLQLPTSSDAKSQPHPQFTINIEKDGSVNVKEHHYDLDGLEKMLTADKDVPFKDFVHVIDHCQKAAVSDIGIATKP